MLFFIHIALLNQHYGPWQRLKLIEPNLNHNVQVTEWFLKSIKTNCLLIKTRLHAAKLPCTHCSRVTSAEMKFYFFNNFFSKCHFLSAYGRLHFSVRGLNYFVEVKNNGKHLEKKGGFGKLSPFVTSFFFFLSLASELQPMLFYLSVLHFDSQGSPDYFESEQSAATIIQIYWYLFDYNYAVLSL